MAQDRPDEQILSRLAGERQRLTERRLGLIEVPPLPLEQTIRAAPTADSRAFRRNSSRRPVVMSPLPDAEYGALTVE